MNKYNVIRVSELIGADVRNHDGEDLGTVKEFVLDTNRGCVEYAVLSSGGFLGIGDKYFAIPWDALTVDVENHEFVLDVSKDRLKDAPGFDKDNWPDMANRDWGESVYSYFGVSSSWQRVR